MAEHAFPAGRELPPSARRSGPSRQASQDHRLSPRRTQSPPNPPLSSPPPRSPPRRNHPPLPLLTTENPETTETPSLVAPSALSAVKPSAPLPLLAAESGGDARKSPLVVPLNAPGRGTFLPPVCAALPRGHRGLLKSETCFGSSTPKASAPVAHGCWKYATEPMWPGNAHASN